MKGRARWDSRDGSGQVARTVIIDGRDADAQLQQGDTIHQLTRLPNAPAIGVSTYEPAAMPKSTTASMTVKA